MGTQPQNLVLSCLLAAVFMAVLDVAVANIALPSIGATLRASGVQLQFVTAGYIAAYGVLLITSARLGEVFGYRRIFTLGVLLFTVASFLCGIAWTPDALITFRVIQGVGAALMMPQVLSLIQLLFADAVRVRALSFYAAVIACGAIVGQILGGVLVGADIAGLAWRPVFLVNVPVGLVLLILCFWKIPRDNKTYNKSHSLDLFGVVLLSVTLLAFLLPITLAHELGWQAWAWFSLALGVLGLVSFIRHEGLLDRKGPRALIQPALVRSLHFSAGALAIFTAMAGYGGMLFLLTVYIQNGLHMGPLITGLAFLPSAVSFGIVSLTWRKLPAKYHSLLPPFGLLLAGASFWLLGMAVGAQAITIQMELAIFGFGVGMGLAFSPLFSQTLAEVPPEQSADASGVLTTANQLGQVLGIAGYGAILLSLFAGSLGAAGSAAITSYAMAIGSFVAATLAIVSGRSSKPE